MRRDVGQTCGHLPGSSAVSRLCPVRVRAALWRGRYPDAAIVRFLCVNRPLRPPVIDPPGWTTLCTDGEPATRRHKHNLLHNHHSATTKAKRGMKIQRGEQWICGTSRVQFNVHFVRLQASRSFLENGPPTFSARAAVVLRRSVLVRSSEPPSLPVCSWHRPTGTAGKRAGKHWPAAPRRVSLSPAGQLQYEEH